MSLQYYSNAPVWLNRLPACTHSTSMNHYEVLLGFTNMSCYTDTEYHWNVHYVSSTNERMKKNKQKGQIKREKNCEEETLTENEM